VQKGRLRPDGHVLLPSGAALVTKAAVEPVWYLPGVAQRFRLQRNGSAAGAVSRDRRHVPRVGERVETSSYSCPRSVGRPSTSSASRADLADPSVELTARVHDELQRLGRLRLRHLHLRPYLTHAIEECIQGVQHGGVGLVSYSRKEGRALGEVTKFLVYNARKAQEAADTGRPVLRPHGMRCGVQDMRFQELMPDVLHWLGVRKITGWSR